MFDPQMELLLTILVALTQAPESSGPDSPPAATFAEAQAAAAACGEIDEDVALAIECEDADALRPIIAEWFAGTRHLLEHDRGVLKRALKAYRKRLKVTVLDAESTLGVGAMSGGRKSTIQGIRPPDRYPRAVWDELVRQGRLVDAKRGLYELPPE